MNSDATYLDTKGAAKYLDCSPSFLNQRRVRGDGPPYIKLGYSVRYKREDLDAWMAENTRLSTSGGHHQPENPYRADK